MPWVIATCTVIGFLGSGTICYATWAIQVPEHRYSLGNSRTGDQDLEFGMFLECEGSNRLFKSLDNFRGQCSASFPVFFLLYHVDPVVFMIRQWVRVYVGSGSFQNDFPFVDQILDFVL